MIRPSASIDEINHFFQSSNEQQPNRLGKKLRISEAIHDKVQSEISHHDADNDGGDQKMSESSMLEFERTFQEMRNEKNGF
jgi:hypothetical protein